MCGEVTNLYFTTYGRSFIGLAASKVVQEVAQVSKEEENRIGNVDEEGIEEGEIDVSLILRNSRRHVIQAS